jgi:transposase
MYWQDLQALGVKQCREPMCSRLKARAVLMEEFHLYAARVQVVEAMEQGLPWYEAAQRAGLEISQSTMYRLRQRMRKAGEQGLREGRHGHPRKLRGEVRKFLEETC